MSAAPTMDPSQTANRRLRRRRLTHAAIAVMLALAVIGLVRRDASVFPPRLYFPPGPIAGIGYPGTKANTPYEFGDLVVCLDKPGSVTIERVELTGSVNGLTIDAFAVITFGFDDRNRTTSIAELGLAGTRESTTVDVVCPLSMLHPERSEAEPSAAHATPGPDPASIRWLLLQYGRSSAQTSSADGLTIFYTSSGHHYQVDAYLSVALCASNDTRHSYCHTS